MFRSRLQPKKIVHTEDDENTTNAKELEEFLARQY